MAMRPLTLDESMGIAVPIAVYWSYSGMYEFLATLESCRKYQLHTKKEGDDKNLVPKITVIKQIIIQQIIQAFMTFILYQLTIREHLVEAAEWAVSARQFVVAMLALDTYQYFMHRYLHTNKFLYRHLHSWHHRIIIPYAFGSQYNHPVEGIISDMLGGSFAFAVSGMSPRASIFFFSLSVMKNIDDHCGMMLPWNIFHRLLWNNTAYHDLHHQYYGSKYNFSQPFFVTWDRVFGTYMPYSLHERAHGGEVLSKT